MVLVKKPTVLPPTIQLVMNAFPKSCSGLNTADKMCGLLSVIVLASICMTAYVGLKLFTIRLAGIPGEVLFR